MFGLRIFYVYNVLKVLNRNVVVLLNSYLSRFGHFIRANLCIWAYINISSFGFATATIFLFGNKTPKFVW